MNIALFLEMAADAAPDRIALVCDGTRWTYADLLAGARGAAALIRQSGVAHVALLDESSEAAVMALFGAALAGVPYVPLNYRLADADLGALLARISPALIVGDGARVRRLCPDATNVIVSRADFVAQAQALTGDAPVDADAGDDVAIQLFTSGTTAAPKAAILRHANLVSYILGTVEFAAAPEEDAALVSVPPYHIAGIAALLSSIYAMRRILMLPAFAPDAWLNLAAGERASNAFVVPTMLARIIEAMGQMVAKGASQPDLSALRAIAYGGGKMPTELIHEALDLFPTTGFTNAYGLTETSSTVALLGPDEHRAAHGSDDPVVRARLGSVGRPLPTVEIEIRDEDGRVLPPGVPGEIYVRGEQVSGEYRERSALDADGWFPTRDAGYIDADGYLFLSGRADDVIVRGGENISPGEIEDVVMTHPAVAEAAAVAIPSHEWGEAVGLIVVPRAGHSAPDEDELKQMVRARLRSSRVPERVLFADALPYNEMGKLLRREIKTLFAR
ncbi:acyl-CoA synthetase (AMP-forming)/AMP-acid ligase II [Sphingobium xenophagum]|uniref:Acyl-CoA synthetase (AMP-forming)/AMP-acid ligase II n=1 Tax=Sphingobium xenophagum TaxID=121428 RepID=A0ABU1WXZ1_SPHXE|nr:AMP-binding protein [Sphingobium xenophagum]MDR7154193.1 acyl-CoA synthetase (AMP-forming)/AMP-acid ligase II [Sphingobium xenophagum]